MICFFVWGVEKKVNEVVAPHVLPAYVQKKDLCLCVESVFCLDRLSAISKKTLVNDTQGTHILEYLLKNVLTFRKLAGRSGELSNF